jgi:hypothetical protein
MDYGIESLTELNNLLKAMPEAELRALIREADREYHRIDMDTSYYSLKWSHYSGEQCPTAAADYPYRVAA